MKALLKLLTIYTSHDPPSIADHLPHITITMSVAATVAKRIMPLFDRVLVQVTVKTEAVKEK